VVSFTPRPLYSWVKSPQYQLDRRLCGPQKRSERRAEEKNLAPIGTRTPTPPARPARSQSLYRLSYLGSLELLTAPANRLHAHKNTSVHDNAKIQAVTRRLLIVKHHVQSQSSASGICGAQCGTGGGDGEGSSRQTSVFLLQVSHH
jgi:hypothetical protein